MLHTYIGNVPMQNKFNTIHLYYNFFITIPQISIMITFYSLLTANTIVVLAASKKSYHYRNINFGKKRKTITMNYITPQTYVEL